MSNDATEPTAPAEPTDPTEFWEQRYGSSDRIWSGKPNPLLVREVADLTPGTALDLGCGEGADAVWLATQGWTVTGVDISQTALDRAAVHAADAGVADRTTWERHELGVTFPDGSYDLVNAHYLQSPVALDQDGVLRSAAEAVAPGGTLLVVMHGGWPSWAEPHEHSVPHAVFPTLDEVLDVLSLPEDEWTVVTKEGVERASTAPDGRTGTHVDNVWRLERSASRG
ncbi:methyltransferase domain-containing protein [Mumia sp. zg.B17]|uniref:class I SAM-dependent methyltransferase n=1 Tax=Mumia sp. zg.B17 TaxID=2855446 RepID=UPI001C6F2A08|nr:class I SAM-dependent methyltransferase [Mumia sp. zg.B17]MBW9205732.1 methyltransferase domain-containing protein [Mumia sp. zg.B17]